MEKNANRYLFQSKHFCTFVKSLTKSTLAFMTVIVLMHADRQMPATHYCSLEDALDLTIILNLNTRL